MVLWYSRLNMVTTVNEILHLKQQDRNGDLGVRCSESVERAGILLCRGQFPRKGLRHRVSQEYSSSPEESGVC